MSEAKGIKEIKEVIEGLGLLYKVGKEVMADGKVDFSDVTVIMKFQGQLPVLMGAVQGLSDVGAEAKDISGEEAIELLGLLFAKVKEA